MNYKETMKQLVDQSAILFNTTSSDIISKSKLHIHSVPRTAVIQSAYILNLTISDIARFLNRDRSTVRFYLYKNKHPFVDILLKSVALNQ